MVSNCIIFVPYFVKIGRLVRKLVDTPRQHGYLINPFLKDIGPKVIELKGITNYEAQCKRCLSLHA